MSEKSIAVPNDTGAEQSLLGAWLSEGNKHLHFLELPVPPEAFYYDEHVQIATVISEFVQKGKGVDPVLVATELTKRGALDRVGGLAYLQKLVELVPTEQNVKYYGEIVIEAAKKREIIRIARDAYEMGFNPIMSSFEMQEEIAKALDPIRDMRDDQSSSEVCGQLLSLIVDGQKRKNVPTSGLQGLDGMLHGFFPGTMYTISARMSVGKSALLSWIALQAGRQKFPTAFVSLEMKPQILAWRMVSALSGVNASKYFTNDMTDEELTRVMKANQRLSELPIRFISAKKRVDDVCLAIRKAKITANIAVAGVDYLQMLHDAGHVESRTAELDGISTKLKSLAEELDIALLCVVAVNRRSVTEKGGVSVADMRGSDGIAYDADCCIILNEDENGVGLPEDVVRINVNIGKNRNGKTGESVVYFDRRFQRFLDEAPNG